MRKDILDVNLTQSASKPSQSKLLGVSRKTGEYTLSHSETGSVSETDSSHQSIELVRLVEELFLAEFQHKLNQCAWQ